MLVSGEMELLENINPKLYRKCEEREVTPGEEDDNVVDPFDSREVFGILWLHSSGLIYYANTLFCLGISLYPKPMVFYLNTVNLLYTTVIYSYGIGHE
jgi:hypothetical protein